LFILLLPSFAHEASEYPGFEVPLYTALSSLKWDELSLNYWNLLALTAFATGYFNKETRSLSLGRKSISKVRCSGIPPRATGATLKVIFLKNASLSPALADSPPALAGY
jgi:hypothetical protein